MMLSAAHAVVNAEIEEPRRGGSAVLLIAILLLSGIMILLVRFARSLWAMASVFMSPLRDTMKYLAAIAVTIIILLAGLVHLSASAPDRSSAVHGPLSRGAVGADHTVYTTMS
jgi:hypothetical protein